MFEQPDPTPEQRDRHNRQIAHRLVGTLVLMVMTYFTTRSVFKASLRIVVPALMLLLIFGPVLIGQWLGKRRPTER